MKVLIDERLLYSEKEGGTVSLSHEKLLEAWPALQRYVTTNKKQLLDHTLLKVRAQQWETAGKSRLRGLASAREAKDFQRAEVTRTPMTDEYLQVSHQFRTWRNWIVGLLGFICTILGGYASLDQWVQAQGHEGLESGMVAKFLLTRVGHRVGIDLLSPRWFVLRLAVPLSWEMLEGKLMSMSSQRIRSSFQDYSQLDSMR